MELLGLEVVATATLPTFIGADLLTANLKVDLNLDETGCALMGHESAAPAVGWVEVLLVTPKHFQCSAGRFFPTQPVIDMSFP
jgi:hypothetical protein